MIDINKILLLLFMQVVVFIGAKIFPPLIGCWLARVAAIKNHFNKMPLCDRVCKSDDCVILPMLRNRNQNSTTRSVICEL